MNDRGRSKGKVGGMRVVAECLEPRRLLSVANLGAGVDPTLAAKARTFAFSGNVAGQIIISQAATADQTRDASLDDSGKLSGDYFATGSFTQGAQSTVPPATNGPLTMTASSGLGLTLQGRSIGGTLAGFADTSATGGANAQGTAYVGEIDWGDGTTSAATIVASSNATYQVQADHAYAADGSYAISLRIGRADSPGEWIETNFVGQLVLDASVSNTGLTLEQAMSTVFSDANGTVASVAQVNTMSVASTVVDTLASSNGTADSGSVTMTGDAGDQDAGTVAAGTTSAAATASSAVSHHLAGAAGYADKIVLGSVTGTQMNGLGNHLSALGAGHSLAFGESGGVRLTSAVNSSMRETGVFSDKATRGTGDVDDPGTFDGEFATALAARPEHADPRVHEQEYQASSGRELPGAVASGTHLTDANLHHAIEMHIARKSPMLNPEDNLLRIMAMHMDSLRDGWRAAMMLSVINLFQSAQAKDADGEQWVRKMARRLLERRVR